MDELNQAILECLDILNKKESKAYKQSRAQRFVEIDKPALRPLPTQEYDVSSWFYQIKVPEDYHIKYDGSYYSVPYQHRFQKVDLRVTQTTLEVMLNRQCIASHLLRDTPGQSTVANHMPEAHYRQIMTDPPALIEWADKIGENVREWVRKNLEERKNFANGLKSVKNLQKWVREERNYEQLNAACAIALECKLLTFQSLKRIAANRNALPSRIEATAWVKDHGNLRGAEYYQAIGGQHHAE